jgi:hypothetical protein
LLLSSRFAASSALRFAVLILFVHGFNCYSVFFCADKLFIGGVIHRR